MFLLKTYSFNHPYYVKDFSFLGAKLIIHLLNDSSIYIHYFDIIWIYDFTNARLLFNCEPQPYFITRNNLPDSFFEEQIRPYVSIMK
jgi:hypothetical protein